MPTFAAADGVELSYRVVGEGDLDPVVCVPGGPMQASVYLGDLGGLDAHRSLVMLDLRGTGGSGAPADEASYRCDRQVADVEALRLELGLERMNLLGHSAGASLVVRYAAEHPERVGSLALITPSPRPVGIDVQADTRREILALRKGEPWHEAAAAAFQEIAAGRGGESHWDAVAPMAYGRWDDVARAHLAAEVSQRNDAAAAIYYADGAFDPPAIRAALAKVDAPVLLIAGELDWGTPPSAAAEFAALFPNAHLVIQPKSSHFPWLDTPDPFVTTLTTFWAEGH